MYSAGMPRQKRGSCCGCAFRVYRGIYGHSSKYLARWFKDWNPDGIICQIYGDRLAEKFTETRASR